MTASSLHSSSSSSLSHEEDNNQLSHKKSKLSHDNHNSLTYILNSIFVDNEEYEDEGDSEDYSDDEESVIIEKKGNTSRAIVLDSKTHHRHNQQSDSSESESETSAIQAERQQLQQQLKKMKQKLKNVRKKKRDTPSGAPQQDVISGDESQKQLMRELHDMKRSFQDANAQMVTSLAHQLEQVISRSNSSLGSSQHSVGSGTMGLPSSAQQQRAPLPPTPPTTVSSQSSSPFSTTYLSSTTASKPYHSSSHQYTAGQSANGVSATSAHHLSGSHGTFSTDVSSSIASELRQEVLNQSTKIKILDEQLSEARQTISTQHRKISILDKDRNSEVQSLRDLYESKVQALQEKCDLSEKRSAALESNRNREKQENKTLKKEVARLRDTVAEYQSQIEAQRDDYEKMASVIHQLREQEQNWIQKDHKFHTVEEKYRQLIEQMETLKAFSEEVDDRNKELLAENRNLRAEFDERQTRSDSDYEQVIRRLTASLEKSTEQTEKLGKHVEQLQMEKDELEESCRNQETKAKQLSAHTEELQGMLESEQKARRVDITSAEEVFDRKLQEVYSRERIQKEKLREATDTIKILDERLQKNDGQSQEEIATWRQRFEEEKDVRQRLESALSKAKKRIEGELKSRMSQKSRTRELEMEVDHLQRAKTQDTLTINQLGQQINELKDNVTVYREMYESLTQAENGSPDLTQYQNIRKKQLSLHKIYSKLHGQLQHFSEDFGILENNYKKMQHILKEIRMQHENGDDDEISVTDLHLLKDLQLDVDKNISAYKKQVVEMVDTLEEDRDKFNQLKKSFRKFEKKQRSKLSPEDEEVLDTSSSATSSDDEDERSFLSKGPSPRKIPPRSSSQSDDNKPVKHKSKTVKRAKSPRRATTILKSSSRPSSRSKSRPKSQRKKRSRSPTAASITHKLAEELRQLQQQRANLLAQRSKLRH